MSNQVPAAGDWAGVAAAVKRLREQRDNMPVSALSRKSGVSETTIRYLASPKKRQVSTLVALSAVLGCRPGYLVDVHAGKCGEDGSPPTLADFAEAIIHSLQTVNGWLCEIADAANEINARGRGTECRPNQRLETGTPNRGQ